MHSLGARVLGCWALWFKCVMARDLDALFQSAILHVLPVQGEHVSSGHSPACLNFLFKILLSVASLGYLFDMTLLSTWRGTLVHQLGRKALGWAASVCLFCFLELNTATLTHPHLPTPHQGALFPSLCRKFFKASAFNLFLIFYFIIRFLPIGTRGFGWFVGNFCSAMYHTLLGMSVGCSNSFFILSSLLSYGHETNSCRCFWPLLAGGGEKSGHVHAACFVFLCAHAHVHNDMQALPEGRDCAVCSQLLPGAG